MDNELQRELNQYYRDIDSMLLCDKRKKNQIISSIRAGITELIDKNPNIDIGFINEHFGSPKQIADEYYNNTDAEEIRANLKSKKRITLYIIILLIAMLLLYVASIIIVTKQSINEVTGYYMEYIEDITSSDIP